MDTLAARKTTSSNDGSFAAAELSVAWVGHRPDWLELDGARRELAGVELAFAPDSRRSRHILPRLPVAPDVIHLARSRVTDVSRLRQAFPGSALVLDLSHATQKRWMAGRALARQRAAADLIVLGSSFELREARRHYPQLATRTVCVERPLDLERHAPPQALLHRSEEFGEFRRARRLHGPVLLFAGPYATRGALDMAIAAAGRLRARVPGLRLAAIREGELDEAYLRRCRQQADALDVVTVLEDAPAAHELPFWYAAAKVVCVPSRDGAGAEPARLAAAAGRALVGSEVEPLLERVADGETGLLVPVDDLEALVEAVEMLLTDEEERESLGELARRRMEDAASPAAAAGRLRWHWEAAVAGHKKRAQADRAPL